MSERFSIKGKGAELFYGDEREHSGDAVPQAPSPAPPGARQTDSLPAGQTDSGQDSKTASKTARQTDSPPAWPEATVRRLRDALREEHPVHNTFRYSRRDLDRLRDIVYELEVKRRLKTSRNDVMRLALAWIIDDYRERGPDSLLVAALRDDAGRPGP